MTDTDLPGVSLVIISHNEERNIGDCLSAVSWLEYPRDKLEVIVVDSSSDRTCEIVRAHRNVTLIASASSGFSAKRNEGWRAASHELIAFLDADCMAPPDYLYRMVPGIAQPDVAGVGANAYPPPDATFFGLCVACLGKPAGGAIGFDCEARFLERGVTYIGSGCSIFRRSALDAVGGFDEDLRHGHEDVNVCERLRKSGYALVYQPDAFIYHKTRDSVPHFCRWAFRRGRAHLSAFSPTWKRLILEPFSALWPFVGIVSLFLVPPAYLLGSLGAALLLILCVITVRRRRGSALFPTGGRKLTLLIQRRRRIGISLPGILFVVVPLFYLDRLIINIAQLYGKVQQGRKKPRVTCGRAPQGSTNHRETAQS